MALENMEGRFMADRQAGTWWGQRNQTQSKEQQEVEGKSKIIIIIKG